MEFLAHRRRRMPCALPSGHSSRRRFSNGSGTGETSRRPDEQKSCHAEELERWRKAVREGNDWVASHKTQEVAITSHDGLNLRGLLVPAEGGMEHSRKFLLAIHGYRSGPMREYYYMLPFTTRSAIMC